eukprot:6254581-Alexandrium_andersonii.AAC.1
MGAPHVAHEVNDLVREARLAHGKDRDVRVGAVKALGEVKGGREGMSFGATICRPLDGEGLGIEAARAAGLGRVKA